MNESRDYDTIWNNHLDVIYCEEFYKIGSGRPEWYGTKEETMAAQDKNLERYIARQESPEQLPDKAKAIILPMIRRMPKCKSVTVREIGTEDLFCIIITEVRKVLLYDLTIPEAEVAYQKAVIRGAWWFLAFLVACVVVYFIVQKIVQDRKDARYHARQLARIKATGEIGQTGFYTAQAHSGHIIREMQKEIERKNRHIAMLEETMAQMTLGDVADKIRKEADQ